MKLKYIRLGLYGLCLGLIGLMSIKFYFNPAENSYLEYKTNNLPVQIGGPFHLTDHHGKTRKHTDFYGKIQMIYFGYSFCPDICPLGLQNMSKALEQMGKDIDQIFPIFITIDPNRDTVEFLGPYSQNWHSSFIFLTGSLNEIGKTLKNYKVYAQKSSPSGTQADYLMDHSSLIYFMDRQGKFIESLPHSADPNKIASTLNKILLKELQQ